MRIQTEIRVTIWTLLVFQLVTAGGAILLLNRMAPAIRNILQENGTSIKAMQRMQRILAEPPAGKALEERQKAFAAALDEAKKNLTEAEEKPVLLAIEKEYLQAIMGDPHIKARMLKKLDELSEINYRSMDRADEQAVRIGFASAWAIVALGILCFIVSIWLARKTEEHIATPFMQIHKTLVAYQSGDTFRRCEVHDAASEMVDVAASVNQILDGSKSLQAIQAPPTTGSERAALLALLDEQTKPMLVITKTGELFAANSMAMDRMSRTTNLRKEIFHHVVGPVSEEESDSPIEKWRPAGTELYLVQLKI